MYLKKPCHDPLTTVQKISINKGQEKSTPSMVLVCFPNGYSAYMGWYTSVNLCLCMYWCSVLLTQQKQTCPQTVDKVMEQTYTQYTKGTQTATQSDILCYMYMHMKGAY